MATTTTKLQLVFNRADSAGKTMTLSYKYAKADVSTAQVQALATGIITNGSIFKKTPGTVKSAKLISTTENTFDLNS